MKPPVNGPTLAVITLAAALGLNLAGPHRAYAAPGGSVVQSDSGPAVTVLSPTPRTTFTGLSPVEISAFYQGTNANPISELELYVDGHLAKTKRLEVPEPRGVVSFLIDSSLLTQGTHRIVVRAMASDAEIVSAKSSFIYTPPANAGDQAVPVTSGLPAPITTALPSLPELSIVSPSLDRNVSGIVRIEVNATDPSGKPPYVSLFIDKAFKTLKNYPPYEFTWDTTAYTNGMHTIEAFGYNDDQNVGKAKVMQVYVNNPGGRTELRTDLQDGHASARPNAAAAPRPTAAPRVQPSPALTAQRPHSTLGKRAAGSRPLAMSNIALPGAQAVSPSLSMPSVQASTPAVASPKKLAARPANRGRALLANSSAHAGLKAAQPSRMAKAIQVPLESTPWNLAPGLSDPFIPASHAPRKAPRASVAPIQPKLKPMPVQVSAAPIQPKLKPMPVQIAAAPARPKFKPMPVRTARAGSPLNAPVALKTRRIHTDYQGSLRMAEAQVPTSANANLAGNALSSPFLAAPRIQPLPAKAHATVAAIHSPVAGAHGYRRFGLHTATTMSTANLLRSRGQNYLMVNGSKVHLDRALAAKGSMMFGPLRPIFEFEGGSIAWRPATNTVFATSPSGSLKVTIGKKHAAINDQAVTMSRAPYLSSGRTMVPIALLSTALDATVEYDAVTGHISMTSNKK